jgi:hypothetical protein
MKDELDEDSPLWLVNEQIKGLLEGEGADEDHEDVLAFLRQTGLPEETVKRMHSALVFGDTKVRAPAAGKHANLYASLTGPLLGLYFPMPADIVGENQFRAALASSKLAKLWCSIYTEEQVDESIAKWGGWKLPEKLASALDYDTFAVATEAAGGKP